MILTALRPSFVIKMPQNLVAGEGIAPPSYRYERYELLLLYPAIPIFLK